MIHPINLQRLALVRMQEAMALFDAGKYDGCVYLCGYVVELALKACVCKALDLQDYPSDEQGLKSIFRTHDFATLEVLSGLRNKIKDQQARSRNFEKNWSLATSWKPELRYELEAATREDARNMLACLNATPEGVLTWLSHQW